MEYPIGTDVELLASRLRLSSEQVRSAITLFDEGFSVPFLARYRRRQLGNLDEEHLLQLRTALAEHRALDDRKQSVLRSIASQGHLTEALEQQIRQAPDMRQLEDLYLPFRRRKRSKSGPHAHGDLEGLLTRMLDPAATVDLDHELEAIAASEVTSSADLREELGDLLVQELLHAPEHRARIRDLIENQATILARPYVELAATESSAASEPHSSQVPDGLVELAADADASTGGAEAAEAGADEFASTTDTAAVDMGAADEYDRHPADSVPVTSHGAPTETEGPSDGEPCAEGIRDGLPRLRAVESIVEQRRTQRREARRKRRHRLENTFRSYFRFRKPIGKITPFEMLALDQGERLRVLQLHYEYPMGAIQAACHERLALEHHPRQKAIQHLLKGALPKELDLIAREVQRDLVARADARKLQGQRLKLQRILMQRPVPVPVVAIEPQIRRESTVVALDAQGNLLASEMISFCGTDERVAAASAQLRQLLAQHQAEIVVVGDCPGFREVHQRLTEFQDQSAEHERFRLGVVRSAATGWYSRSPAANREFPNQPDQVRRTVALGRRFQNPFLEFVKLDAGRLARLLFNEETRSEAFDQVVQETFRSCTARLGADANRSDAALLRYVPGLNSLYAQKIEQKRRESKQFADREAIRAVEGIDQQALTQALPFLLVPDSSQPLDSTAVHPDDYPLAQAVLAVAELTLEDLAAVLLESRTSPGPVPSASRDRWRDRLAAVDPAVVVSQSGASREQVVSLLQQLDMVGDDPWKDMPEPVLRDGPVVFDQLQRSDEVTGSIVHLVDFGAFVDLGAGVVGLLHVSRLARDFVADPKELLDEGEQLRMWVVDLEAGRKRVSLSLLPPKARPPRWERRPTPATSRGPSRSERTPHGQAQQTRSAGRQPPRTKRAPAPVVPITEAMKDGREPMRTFSDLMQFYQHQRTDEPPAKKPTDGPDQ